MTFDEDSYVPNPGLLRRNKTQYNRETNPHNADDFWFNKKFCLTVHQEFWCWRFAYHGNGMKAVREAYKGAENNRNYQNTLANKMRKNDRVIAYVSYLRDAHRNGKLDLGAGPWAYFDLWDVGNIDDPGNSITVPILEFRKKTKYEDSPKGFCADVKKGK